ncbi:hypothetical protein [Pseudanabaena sp. ABRG5-3]|uniref:hypothetical protein n=1 Tax=Pseudanabaena sp. ABRG5-3 TaxID=685565 RepID=UPI000DC6E734|nr:hypothetical protein [Pseudanabaena sp. ABRG5-3]BBC27236.1 hypothetical protein ABRG53_g010 [Pseudanabaena sp. ABRG5-3]
MPEKQATSLLQDIRIDLDIAISQLTAFNIYIDAECEDSHLSNCMIGLTQSLSSISSRLKSLAIAPSVTLEDRTNG